MRPGLKFRRFFSAASAVASDRVAYELRFAGHTATSGSSQFMLGIGTHIPSNMRETVPSSSITVVIEMPGT